MGASVLRRPPAVDRRPWGNVGLTETVIYSGTTPDPVYLIPIFPYYLMQHNERENDNILWFREREPHGCG